MRKRLFLILSCVGLMFNGCGNNEPTTTAEPTEIVEDITTENTEQVLEVPPTEVETESVVETEPEETDSVVVEEPPNTETKDEFTEEFYIFYLTEPVVLYDAPNEGANVVETYDAGEIIQLTGYNAKTGWYKTYWIGDDSIYGRLGGYLTPEEYNAIVNQGVEEKYYVLDCVAGAFGYSQRSYGIVIDDVNNLACVHTRGQHNFVTPDVAKRCSDVCYNARVSWLDGVHAVDNQDGTVDIYKREYLVPRAISMQEYYEIYANQGVMLYPNFDAYMYAKEQYLIDSMLAIINAE